MYAIGSIELCYVAVMTPMELEHVSEIVEVVKPMTAKWRRRQGQ